MAQPTEEKLTAGIRVNLAPTELAQLQELAERDDRTVSAVVRRAVRELLGQEAERSRLRRALAAYRSALRSGEPESDQLRAIGDEALEVPRG